MHKPASVGGDVARFSVTGDPAHLVLWEKNDGYALSSEPAERIEAAVGMGGGHAVLPICSQLA